MDGVVEGTGGREEEGKAVIIKSKRMGKWTGQDMMSMVVEIFDDVERLKRELIQAKAKIGRLESYTADCVSQKMDAIGRAERAEQELIAKTASCEYWQSQALPLDTTKKKTNLVDFAEECAAPKQKTNASSSKELNESVVVHGGSDPKEEISGSQTLPSQLDVKNQNDIAGEKAEGGDAMHTDADIQHANVESHANVPHCAASADGPTKLPGDKEGGNTTEGRELEASELPVEGGRAEDLPKLTEPTEEVRKRKIETAMSPEPKAGNRKLRPKEKNQAPDSSPAPPSVPTDATPATEAMASNANSTPKKISEATSNTILPSTVPARYTGKKRGRPRKKLNAIFEPPAHVASTT